MEDPIAYPFSFTGFLFILVCAVGCLDDQSPAESKLAQLERACIDFGAQSVWCGWSPNLAGCQASLPQNISTGVGTIRLRRDRGRCQNFLPEENRYTEFLPLEKLTN